MLKNILFVLGATLVLIALWWVYQLIGEYLFLFFLVVAVTLLLSNIKKPKFGNNNKKSNK